MTNAPHLYTLRFVALLFLLPGLAGMFVSASISTRYLEELPRMPVPAEMRMTPINIHGVVVYETVEEHKRLCAIEHSSTVCFLAGLGLGLVYMRRWGVANAIGAEEDEYAENTP